MRNYKLWGILFLCFVTVAVFQSLTLSKQEDVVLYHMEKSDPGTRPYIPPPPAAAPKTDPWVWLVRIGGVMTGCKTLLDIIDKLRKRPK